MPRKSKSSAGKNTSAATSLDVFGKGINRLLRKPLPRQMPENPFCAKDPNYPLDYDSAKLDLAEFSVEDEWLEGALQFQLQQQLMRDGIQYFTRSAALHCKTSINDEWNECVSQASRTYKVSTDAQRMSEARRPAQVAYLDRSPPRISKDSEGSLGFLRNERTWYIGITVNRNRSALAFVNWIKKDFLLFMISASKLIANIEMRGVSEFSKEDIKSIEKCMGKKVMPTDMDKWLADRKAAEATAVSSRKNQQRSAHDLRARLLAVACFRYHQAGYDWHAYEKARRRIASNEPKMTESNWRQRLKLADQILREEWARIFEGPPEEMPGVMWRPIRRSKTQRHLL